VASPTDARRQRVATIWLVGMTVVWGSTFFSAKIAIDAMEACPSAKGAHPAFAPVMLMVLRFIAASLLYPILLPWAVRELTWEGFKAAFWMALACVGGCLFQIVGLAMTTPSVSAFLTSLTVLFVPMVVWVWSRRTPSRSLALAVVMSVLGLALLTGPGGGWGIGQSLNLLGSICFAVQIVMIDRMMPKVPLAGTTWLLFIISSPLSFLPVLFLGAWGTLMGTPWVREVLLTGRVWVPLAYLVLPGTILAISIANHYQKDLNPTRAAVIYTLEPLFAALFSYRFYGERFTAAMIAGGSILLAGNLVAELAKRKDASGDMERRA